MIPCFLLFAALVQADTPVNDGFGRPPKSADREKKPTATARPTVFERVAGPDSDDVQVSTPSDANQNEMVMRVNPLDRTHLIGGANDDRGVDFTCAFYSSQDAGATWTELLYPVRLPTFDAAGDPAAAFGPNGEVYFCALEFVRTLNNSSLIVGESLDGGATVPNWVEAIASPPGAFEDKQFLTADSNPASPFAGTLYITWTRFSGGFAVNPIMCTSSSDGGVTWTTPVQVSDGNNAQGSVPCVGPNGELYVAWLDLNSNTVTSDVSLDGGLTFGTDVAIQSSNCNLNNAPHRFNCFPTMDIDSSGGPFHGNIYVGWMSQLAGQSDILVSRSADGGATWSFPLRASDDLVNDQFFPWLDVDPNGNVNVGFMDRRDDPNNNEVGFYVARSSDGGASYQPNQRVADAAFNPFTYPDGTFIGDYNGLAASDRSVHPLWCDGRNATNDTFTSKVNLDFYEDVEEISVVTGGTVTFTLNAGPLYSGANYRVIGSVTGTSPGITFGTGVNVPVNFDIWTQITVTQTGSGLFTDFVGTLDTEGSANPQFVLPSGIDPGLIGVEFHHSAFVDNDGPVLWASNPGRMILVP